MKIDSIASAAQDFKGAKNNMIWINAESENGLEKALMRSLAGQKGTIKINQDGSFYLEFKILRRKQ